MTKSPHRIILNQINSKLLQITYRRKPRPDELEQSPHKKEIDKELEFQTQCKSFIQDEKIKEIRLLKGIL